MSIFGREPAVVVGIAASVVLAVVASLQGNGVISGELPDILTRALSPDGGWAIPIIVGIVTRFLVYSPNTVATDYIPK